MTAEDKLKRALTEMWTKPIPGHTAEFRDGLICIVPMRKGGALNK